MFDCFIHHINKEAYKQPPGQEHIQGGAGLVQKVRLAIQLTEGHGNIRCLSIVKGNYCPLEYKQNSIELLFSEETFLFSATGKKVPTNELVEDSIQKAKDNRKEQSMKVVSNISQNKSITYTEFVQAFSEMTGRSEPTVKRVHAEIKKNKIIVESNGLYRLANSFNENDIEDDQDGDL